MTRPLLESGAWASRRPGAGCPVFIVGTERSGSNLLRLILDAHPEIAIPHPPHFMRYLAPIGASYGDLRDDRNRRALVRDALRLLRRHIHPWEHPIDEDRVVAEANPTVFGVVAAIHEQYREAEGKPRWGCKSTFMVDHADDVLAEYPSARLVWLVRDPRDVAASGKRAVFGPCSPILTARLWLAQQRLALQAHERWGPETVHLLRYEELVAHPDEEVPRLCAFLGVPFEPAMLAHHRSDAARRLASLSESWRNASRPITTASVGRHERGLSERERRWVEQVARPMMSHLGYAVDAGSPPPALPPALAVRAHDLALGALVEWRSLRRDANHWRRWSRDRLVRRLRRRAALRTLAARVRR